MNLSVCEDDAHSSHDTNELTTSAEETCVCFSNFSRLVSISREPILDKLTHAINAYIVLAIDHMKQYHGIDAVHTAEVEAKIRDRVMGRCIESYDIISSPISTDDMCHFVDKCNQGGFRTHFAYTNLVEVLIEYNKQAILITNKYTAIHVSRKYTIDYDILHKLALLQIVVMSFNIKLYCAKSAKKQ